MKATEAKFLGFLKRSPQFTIPIYQRTYSWTEAQCRQLWEDILRAGANDKIFAHFIGSIVYIEKGLYQVSSQSPLLVIDGQQRLTTVSLVIAALARHLGDSEPIDGFSAKKLRHYYLLNPLEDGKQRYKLLLTQTDEQTLQAIVDQDERSPMRELFELFRKEVLALDPCVSEEVLKVYIAYKAETNFVDIVPQARQLRLSLNMQFHELQDSRGLAKDVTNLGRWGNGDVEVGLNRSEELPYVMGLVRQALEMQLGNGENEG